MGAAASQAAQALPSALSCSTCCSTGEVQVQDIATFSSTAEGGAFHASSSEFMDEHVEHIIPSSFPPAPGAKDTWYDNSAQAQPGWEEPTHGSLQLEPPTSEEPARYYDEPYSAAASSQLPPSTPEQQVTPRPAASKPALETPEKRISPASLDPAPPTPEKRPVSAPKKAAKKAKPSDASPAKPSPAKSSPVKESLAVSVVEKEVEHASGPLDSNDSVLQVNLDGVWMDMDPTDRKQIADGLRRKDFKFTMQARGALYVVEFEPNMTEGTQRNPHSGRTHQLRIVNTAT